MKSYLITFLLIAGIAAPFFNSKAQTTSSNSYKLKSVGLVDEYEGRWFTVTTDIKPEDFWMKYKSTLGLTLKDSLHFLGSEDIDNNHIRLTYQQYHNGYKIDGAIGYLYVVNGLVKRLHIDFIKSLIVPTNINIEHKVAFELAKIGSGFKGFSWENGLDTTANQYKKLSLPPKGELLIAAVNGATHFVNSEFRLCWKFEVCDSSLLNNHQLYIDAQTGEIINIVPTSMSCSPTTGATAYNGTQNIATTYYNSTYGYRLTDDCNNSYYTADLITELYSGGSTYFYWSVNNNWTSAGASAGVTSHWAGKMALYYWGSYWGRNSYNSSGTNLYIYNYQNLANANWNGSFMNLGDNTTSGIYDDFNTVDIVGHEFTHGVIQTTAGLIYQKESGALNESFADIFGVATERSTFGVNGYDFRIGEHRGTPLRNMANPNSYGQPDTYGGYNWFNTSSCTPSNGNDQCGVHINSGVQNYWFYLLAAGGSGTNDNSYSYNVTGIQFTDAIAIAYKNLTGYLTSNSVYGDARIGSLWATDQLFGSSSSQKSSVIAAWCAVGLGNTCSSNLIDLTKSTDNLSINGNSITISNTVINSGSATSGSFDIKYYLSTNSDLSTLDYLINTDNVNSLVANSTKSFNNTIDLCSKSIPNGTYYLGYIIDKDNSVTETNENNNTWIWSLNPITISCAPTTYTVSLSSNPSNGGNVSGGGTYNSGQTITVNASANSGWTFTNWTENGSSVSTSPSYQFSITSNRNLTANFTTTGGNTYTVTVLAAPSNGGNVSGGGTFNSGQLITVTATPNSGWTFTNWTENGSPVSSNANYQFSITSNRSLSANFTNSGGNTYSISVTANPSTGGNVSGGGTFNSGQLITVSATPNTGWTFTNWTENGSEVSTNSSYQFTATSNRNLVANFTNGAGGHTITLTSNPIGAGNLLGAGTYLPGLNATVIAQANAGWMFLNWMENGIIVQTTPSYQFTVNSARQLIANFTPATGVESTSENGFTIYPNPTTGLITLVFSQSSNQNQTLFIYNQLGQIVLSEQNLTFDKSYEKNYDLSKMQHGVYYIILAGEKSYSAQKLIIK